MRAWWAGALCVGLLWLCGCGSRTTRDRVGEADPAPLIAGMVERLAIAREVAWSKARSGAAVSDPGREAELLAALVRQGEAAGLDADRVTRFFVAQIAASRLVQEELLAAWAADRAPRPQTRPLDLRQEIRPRMDAVSAALIDALARTPPDAWKSVAFRREIARGLREANLSEEVIAKALQAW